MKKTMVCQTCGSDWIGETDSNVPYPEGEFSARLLSTPSNAVASYPSLNFIAASGETLLTCPKDPQSTLDAAIQRKGQGPQSQARTTGINDPTRLL